MQNKIGRINNKIDWEYENEEIKQSEIELNENETESKVEKENKQGRKFKVNLKNIERAELAEEKLFNKEIYMPNLSKISDNLREDYQKAQIIVISKKRKRDPMEEDYTHDLFLKENSINKKKKYNLEDFVENFQKLKISENSKKEEISIFSNETINSSPPNNEIEIKDRSNKVFSPSHEKCEMCSPVKNKNSNLFQSYYPNTNLNSTQYLNNLRDHEKQKSLLQISDCRQLKFMAKRKIINNKISEKQITPSNTLKNSLFSTNSQSREIKNLYNKLYGDSKIINEKEKLIIVNNKPMSKEEIRHILLNNQEEFTFFTMEVEQVKCQNEEEILNQVQNFEENNLVADASSDSELMNDELDYDSNREDHIANEYPDEDEEDDYDMTYNTNGGNKYEKMIKNAKRNLEKAYRRAEDSGDSDRDDIDEDFY